MKTIDLFNKKSYKKEDLKKIYNQLVKTIKRNNSSFFFWNWLIEEMVEYNIYFYYFEKMLRFKPSIFFIKNKKYLLELKTVRKSEANNELLFNPFLFSLVKRPFTFIKTNTFENKGNFSVLLKKTINNKLFHLFFSTYTLESKDFYFFVQEKPLVRIIINENNYTLVFYKNNPENNYFLFKKFQELKKGKRRKRTLS